MTRWARSRLPEVAEALCEAQDADRKGRPRGHWLPVAAAAACVFGAGLAQPDGIPPRAPSWRPVGPGTWAAGLALLALLGRRPLAGLRTPLLAAAAILAGIARAPVPTAAAAPESRPVAMQARVLRCGHTDTGVWFLVDRLRAPDGRALDRPARSLLVLPALPGPPPEPGEPIALEGLLSRTRGRVRLDHASWRPAAGSGRPASIPLRERVRARLRFALPSEDAGLAAALLLGDSGAAPSALRTSYRSLGLVHLLCVSGMHLWLWNWWLRRLLIGRLAALRAPALIAVAALAGFGPPVTRALAALLLRAGSARRGWRVAPLRLWAAALWIELLCAPARSAGLGFVLSYVATFFLLAVGGTRGRRAMTRTLFASTAAFLGTAPWLLRSFGTVQPWTAPLSPLFALLLPLRLLASAAALAPLLDRPAAWLLASLRAIETEGLRMLDSLPGAPLATPRLAFGAALLASICGLLGLRAWAGRQPRRATLLLGLTAVLCCLRQPARSGVLALPVGHGLAVVVGSGDASLCFDLGSADLAPARLVEELVLPELRRRGWPRPRAIVLSHGDRDHRNGLPELRRYGPVRELRVATGDAIPLPDCGPFRLRLYGCVPGRHGGANAEGQVLEVRAENFRAVLLGDPHGHALVDLCRRLEPGPIDLMLLPHHGRTTAGLAELLDHLRPRVCWVACAEDAKLAAAPLARAQGCILLRTGPQPLFLAVPAESR